MANLILLEVNLFKLEIKIDEAGNVFADVESCNPLELKKVLDTWNAEYPNTQKLVRLVSELNRRLPEFLETLEAEVQAI